MAHKTRNRLLLFILLVIIACGITGYMIWNKEHFSIKNSRPVATITAVELHKIFASDSGKAKNTFIGDENNKKVTRVSGEVAELKKDQQQQQVILLKTSTEGAFINCTMEEKSAPVKVGTIITIQGMCTGYNFDADMGIPGDVVLLRCYLVR